jgi:hypothetical protein
MLSTSADKVRKPIWLYFSNTSDEHWLESRVLYAQTPSMVHCAITIFVPSRKLAGFIHPHR